MPKRSALGLHAYIGLLLLVLAVVLTNTFAGLNGFEKNLVAWLVLSLIFGAAEYVLAFFHYAGARQGLSASEAVLIPMLVGLSFPQVIWGVLLGKVIAEVAHRQLGATKFLFNIGAFGCAAAASAWVATFFVDADRAFGPTDALGGFAGAIVFAVLTHVLVAGAIAIAEGRSFFQLTREVGPTLIWNLLGNISVGLVFAASFLAGTWTVVLFLMPLGGLYLGYRAVLRQQLEHERVEGLHSASRALASSPELTPAVVGFLKATCDMVSASEGVLLITLQKRLVSFAVRGSQVLEEGATVEDRRLVRLLEEVRQRGESLVVAGLSGGPNRDLAAAFDKSNLIVTPLIDDEQVVGCLAVFDRVGAEDFDENDARMMEALGNELVLTLDSYRLFAEVAEERERFRQIFAGSKEGICLLGEGGIIRAWNPALARITGFEEEEILGEKWSERVLVRDRYHRRIEGLEIISVPPDEELELVTRQGPPRWVAIMSGEVPTGDDEKSWVLLVRDITAEHELEESKSDFLSTISHELRTPLTTIKGSLEVLSRPEANPDSDVGKQMIEIMKRGSDRLERLVMNLLAVSQTESGGVDVFPDQFDLEELVRSRIAAILPDHPQVEVQVADQVVVRADKERLSQAVEHLLDNARKFGPESGRITVEIAKDNGYARLSVRDEGPGIPKIDQERIFDRFVRLGHMLTRETQGPGVGLFIVKRSVEAMAGSVELESDPNRGGSTFHVRVPLAHPMAAAEPTSA